METIYTSHDNWLAQRLGKFTASTMSRLMVSGRKKDELFGVTALKYISEVLTEIITGESRDKDLSGADIKSLQHGQAHEYEALTLLQEQIEEKIEFFGLANAKFVEYNAYSGGTPDGLSDTYLVETKCPWNSSVHVRRLIAVKLGKDLNEWLAEYEYDYFIQVQFNMMCCKREKALFVSYDPRATAMGDNRLVVMEIQADKEVQEDIKVRLEKAAEIVSNSLELLGVGSAMLLTNDDGVTIAERA